MLVCLAASLPCFAQNDILTTAAPPKLSVKRGASVAIPLAVRVKQDYHVNTNAPNEEYLIPLRLTWDPKPLTVEAVNYPPGKNEKFDFSQKPVNVYTGDFTIETRFQVPDDARVGLAFASGKLRYQACNLTMCLPPKTIPIQVPLEIH